MANLKTTIAPTNTDDSELLTRLNELEATVKTLQTKRNRPSLTSILKRITIFLMVILCALTINLTALSYWLKRTVVDTDIWTSKTTTLLQNESIRGDIATEITDNIFAATNADQVITESIPPKLSGLTKPLTTSLKSYTTDKTAALLASPKFQTFWQNANQSAHAGIIASLENDGKPPANTDSYIVYINNEKLVLNLKPIIQKLQADLSDAGLSFVNNLNTDNINRTVTLTTIQSLPTILAMFNIINKAAPIFGVLAILFGAGALALSQTRRRTIIYICMSTIVLMVLNVQALYLAQYPLIQQISDTVQAASTASGTAVYDIFVSDLITLNRLIMLLAAIILTVAILSGPGKSATAFRRTLINLTNPKKSSGFMQSISQNKIALISSIAIISALLIVFPPISGQVFPLVIVTIASLACLWLYSIETTSI